MRTLSVEQSQILIQALEYTTEAISLLAQTPPLEEADEEVLNLQEACELLQISPSKMRQVLAIGEIKYKDLRDPGSSKGLYRFLKSDLYSYMRN